MFALATASCGERLRGRPVLERDGVIAAVVPAAPERSVVNSVVYRDAEGLEAAYDELAAAYGEIGAKWTVWVRPDDERGRAACSRARPRARRQPDGDGRATSTGVERPAPDALAGLDRRAATSPTVGAAQRPRLRVRHGFLHAGARRRCPRSALTSTSRATSGEPVGGLADHRPRRQLRRASGSPWSPEARGRGISGKLHAPRAGRRRRARQRDLHAVATPLGHPVYERLGYRPLGRVRDVGARRPPRPARRSPRT